MDNSKIVDFYRSLVPWGILDIEYAINTLESSSVQMRDVIEKVNAYQDSGKKLEDLDICGVIYETALDEARENIYQEADLDLMGYQINVYSNYLDTSFDYLHERVKILEKNLEKFSLSDFNETTQWFFSEIGCEVKE